MTTLPKIAFCTYRVRDMSISYTFHAHRSRGQITPDDKRERTALLGATVAAERHPLCVQPNKNVQTNVQKSE